MSNDIHREIVSIFAEVFQYAGTIVLDTTPDDVPKWDSLQHIALVGAIEQSFAISLSMDEMMEMMSVGDIHNVLLRHGI